MFLPTAPPARAKPAWLSIPRSRRSARRPSFCWRSSRRRWPKRCPAVARLFGRGDPGDIDHGRARRSADIAALLPADTAIIRAMPNTPAAVGRGHHGGRRQIAHVGRRRSARRTVCCAPRQGRMGRGRRPDRRRDCGFGLGPGLCLPSRRGHGRGRRSLRLAAGDLALRLARATVEGAGELLYRSDLTAATLRENVTSPGGTTAAALAVLRAEDGLAPLMVRAVEAAKRRAGELSG